MFPRIFCIIILLMAPTAYAADRQVFSAVPLCDDYIRLKLQEYLNTTENVNYDQYMSYKAQLTDYCNASAGRNLPLSETEKDILKNYNRSLD